MSEKRNASGATEARGEDLTTVDSVQVAPLVSNDAPVTLDASVLDPIVSRVRTDVTATKNGKGGGSLG